MKLVLLQTLCFAILWVGVAPNHRGDIMYGLSQPEAQGPPLKSSLTKGLQLAAFTITTPPPTDDNIYVGGGSENPRPCMPARNNNAYNIFLRKHVRNDTPINEDMEEWKMFFSHNQNLCNRPTQSFLRYRDKSLINNICTPNGGKIYERNLCISNHKFSFITVRIRQGCIISSITRETKHIILACDKIDNVCSPVHFERNRRNRRPNSRAPGCYNRRPASGAP